MFIIKQSYIIKPVEVKILLVCINLKKKSRSCHKIDLMFYDQYLKTNNLEFKPKEPMILKNGDCFVNFIIIKQK